MGYLTLQLPDLPEQWVFSGEYRVPTYGEYVLIPAVGAYRWQIVRAGASTIYAAFIIVKVKAKPTLSIVKPSTE